MYIKRSQVVDSFGRVKVKEVEVEAIKVIKSSYLHCLREYGLSTHEVNHLMEYFEDKMEEIAEDFGMDFEDILESDENVVDDFCLTFEDYMDY